MSQLAPHIVSRAMLVERDPRRRAEMIINAATQLGCNKFVTRPEDVLEVSNYIRYKVTNAC